MTHAATIHRAAQNQPSIIEGYPPPLTLVRRTIPRRLRPAAGIIWAFLVSMTSWGLMIVALF